jgi:hypothetical protein
MVTLSLMALIGFRLIMNFLCLEKGIQFSNEVSTFHWIPTSTERTCLLLDHLRGSVSA